MKSETLIKKVEAFKAELEKYYKATDGSEIPDIETTVIGSGGVIDYRITKTHVIRTEKDGFSTFEDKYKIGYIPIYTSANGRPIYSRSQRPGICTSSRLRSPGGTLRSTPPKPRRTADAGGNTTSLRPGRE